MKILLIDNYDSFTFNLVHYLEGAGASVDVFRNDNIPFSKVNNYDKIVFSPGPGLPCDAGDMNKLIEQVFNKKPILGVCLGFQALIEHFGGKLYNQERVKHGVAENCTIHNEARLFKNIPEQFNIGLYHSWAADIKSFPPELIQTGELDDHTIMAFEHKYFPICGVQFHPESILTDYGHRIVENFLCNFN